MPKNKADSVDAMIEGWATGLTSGTRVSTSAGSDDLADFTLTKPEATPLAAAEAVAAALRANTGRRKNFKHWTPVARDVLGAKRLSGKRYGEVLEAGYAAGLFKLDSDALSFPILVAVAPAPEPEDPELNDPELTARPAPPPPAPAPPSTPPEDWDPPFHMACGHWSWQSVPDPDAEPIVDKGHRARRRTKTVRVLKPGKAHCPACKDGKTGSYRHQTGRYRQSIPEGQRRTKEKSDPSYPGYPGLCADPKTGFYIGGIGNDCRRNGKGSERCIAHATTKSKKPKKNTRKRKSSNDRRQEKSS